MSQQAAIVEEQTFIDLFFPGDPTACLDESRAQELSTLAVCLPARSGSRSAKGLPGPRSPRRRTGN